MAKVSKPRKEYQEFANRLCEEHDRKCLTTKCPLAKLNCYDYGGFAELWRCSPVKRKRVIGRFMHQLMEQEGQAHEQVPQQKG